MCPRVAGLPSSPTLLTAFFYPGPGLSFIFCWWLEYNSTFPHSGGMLYSFRSPGRVNRCILWSARKYFPRPLLLRLLSRAQISDCKELSDSSLSQKFAKLSQPGAFVQVLLSQPSALHCVLIISREGSNIEGSICFGDHPNCWRSWMKLQK